jgi:hypothetical protein
MTRSDRALNRQLRRRFSYKELRLIEATIRLCPRFRMEAYGPIVQAAIDAKPAAIWWRQLKYAVSRQLSSRH